MSSSTITRVTISQSHPSLSVKEVLESQDLLLEILKNLTKQDVMSCRRVSKNWYSLISSLDFFKSWKYSSMKPVGCLLYCPIDATLSRFVYFEDDQTSPRNKSISYSPYLAFPFDKVNILQSCNGLILCCSNSMAIKECFICNVTTKQVVKLNIPSGEDGYMGEIGLAFDPRISIHYKVVFLEFPKVYVYSSDTEEWSCVETGYPFTKLDLTSKVYYNAAIYWTDVQLGYCIRFDFETNSLEELRMPRIQDGMLNSVFCCMSVCGDSLYFIKRAFKEGKELHFVVYEMKGKGSDWVAKYHFTEPMKHIEDGNVDALCVFKDLNSEFCVVLSSQSAIASYSLEENVIRRILFYRFPGKPKFIDYEYVETLVTI